MAPVVGFNFKTLSNNPADWGFISKPEIEKMELGEFYELQGRLVRVRRNRRRDMAVAKTNVKLAAGATIQLFRKGVGEEQPYFGGAINEKYIQTEVQTDMPLGGKFEEGSLTIIHAIEVPFPVASKAAGQANGVVTNPKAVFLENFDPNTYALTWLNQSKLDFWRGESKLFGSYLEDYPSYSNLNAELGSNQGVLTQNGESGINVMSKVLVIEGGEDWHLRLTNLAELDFTTSTGLAVEHVQQIKIHTIEARREHAY